MRLRNLPLHLPGATLYSLVTRIQIVNGSRNDREACAVLFGGTGDRRLADIPADLDVFCAATGRVYGSSDEVIRSTTVLPFFQRLGSRPGLFRSVACKVANVADTVGGESLGLAMLSNGYPHIWRWCRDCVTADQRQQGVAFWRLAHQLPGVDVCTRHGRILIETRIPFRQRQQHFLLPDNIASPTGAGPSPGADAFDRRMRLARLAESILLDTSIPFRHRCCTG